MSKPEPINDQLDAFGGPPPRFVAHPVMGYAARPGGGPAREKCKTCACLTANHYNGKTYYKCALVKNTRGPGSDIRLRSPACIQWRPKP